MMSSMSSGTVPQTAASRFTAAAALGETSDARAVPDMTEYCRMTDNAKSATHARVKPLRDRAVKFQPNPRDAIARILSLIGR